jgi:hypothetical protein
MNNGFTVVKFTIGKFYIFSDEKGKIAEKISSGIDVISIYEDRYHRKGKK